MTRIAIITIAFVLSTLLIAVSQWFENETQKVVSINNEHLAEIKRLKKISQINEWLDTVVRPSLESLPKNETLSENSLVVFYDRYAKEMNFKVSKYIYNDTNSHNLDILFEVRRSEKDTLKKLMTLRYESGFLRFKNFEQKADVLNGTLQLVQPFYGEENASHL